MDLPRPQIRVASDTNQRALPRRFNFTEAKLAGVTCPAGRPSTSVYDTKVAGLAYVVTARDSRSFYLYRKWRGRKINELLGKSLQINVDTARQLATAMNARINAGADVQAERRTNKATIAAGVTVGVLWERYKTDHLAISATKRSLDTDVSLFKALTSIERRRIETLTIDELRALHRRLGTERGKKTADNALRMLRRMINFAHITPNIVAGKAIKWFIGKNENERSRYITAHEMPRFMAALEAEPNETLKDYLKLSLAIGQRRANMQAMRWDELDLAAGVWTIPGSKHKTRRDTRIPLTPIAVAMLNDRRVRMANGAGEWVFPSQRGDAKVPHLTEPRYALQRACKAAGISGVVLHDLRRTVGVWQALGGASELIIGASLGHHDRQSTRRYSQIAQLDPVRTSMSLATNAMFNPLALPKVNPKAEKARKGARAKKPQK